MKKIRVKCWIEEEDEKFYGPGPNELLKRIQKEGSLSKAAEQMHMSYRKAWEMVRRINRHSSEPLIILKKGGQHGGGAEITRHALEIVAEYDRLEQEIGNLVNKKQEFMKLF